MYSEFPFKFIIQGENMNFIQENYIIYVKIDEQNRIIVINSNAFLNDTESWIKIDEGIGDKYHQAQGNYLDKSIYTDDGVPRYKLVDGKPVERTSEEIEADKPEPPAPQPTVQELQEQLTQTQLALTEVYEMILAGGI